ncbi:hypothetical protein PoB_000459800 [Plakobranchus ocellatus]|uniref:HNH nuclease domain-containing protein n=1 Tax=Plakobranchus ocellatus TaxID=259542 RepID=A0AAV3Y6B2_9GAST|nr:hypothetical protein PoB_000459800 [Plakobranchus ocellatus]
MARFSDAINMTNEEKGDYYRLIGTPRQPIVLARALKKKCWGQKVSLKCNKGHAKMNILNEKDPRNIVHIRGVNDSQVNWIDLEIIHRLPINRVGNPAALPHHANPGFRGPISAIMPGECSPEN